MAHVRFIHNESRTLGIEYLSAVLKQSGHTTDMIFDLYPIFDVQAKSKTSILRKRFIQLILRNKPDVLAFSVSSVNIEWVFLLAETIKAYSDIPILVGGIQPTLIPEAFIDKEFIDYVIVGEGEGACVELVNGIARSDVNPQCANLWLKRDGQVIRNAARSLICPLDTLPFPDKKVNPFCASNFGEYSIVTGRGCLGQCTYCCVPAVHRAYYQGQNFVRRRSPENVIAELVGAKVEYGIKRVFFDDDLFTHDNQWLANFAVLYKQHIDLPCTLCAHPSFINEALVSSLRQIRCCMVEIGVQSLNPVMREKTLKRFYTNDQVRKSLMLLNSSGISCSTDNIVGLPGENPDDVLEMVKFYNELRPGKVDVLYLKYYPKAEILGLTDWPLVVLEEFHRGKQYDLVVQSAAFQRTKQLGLINKIVLVLVFTYFLPRRVVQFVLDKKWYLYFPSFSSCYDLNERFYYFFALFTPRGRRSWPSIRTSQLPRISYIIKLWFSLCLGGSK